MALTQYDLSRQFWNFAFENPEKVKPTHIAIYFFAIEHCNRLGWKEKFGLPTSMVLDAIGLKSYNSYKKHFDDLAAWGFIKVLEESKNQFSSNIIALSNALSKNVKALDKALSKHASKQRESTGESTGSIDKQVTRNKELLTTTTKGNYAAEEGVNVYAKLEQFKTTFLKDQFAFGMICQKGVPRENVSGWIDAFNRRLIFTADTLKSERDWRSHFSSWIVKVPNYVTAKPEDYQPIKDAELPKPIIPTGDDKFKKLLGKS